MQDENFITNITARFFSQIRREMTARRMSQVELARRLEVSESYVSKLLRNQEIPSLRRLAEVADAVGMTLELGLRPQEEWVDFECVVLVERSKAGNPEALHEILEKVAQSAQAGEPIAPGYRDHLLDILNRCLDNDEAWYEAVHSFEEAGPLDEGSRRGQLPEKALRQLGSNICKAAYLSDKPNLKSLRNLIWELTDKDIKNVLQLRYYGASLAEAIKIALSGGTSRLSARQIRTRLRAIGRLGLPKAGTLDWAYGPHLYKLRAAIRVWSHHAQGTDLESAYEIVGQEIVTELPGLTRATRFLKPENVKASFAEIEKSGDPKWLRARRLITHCASVRRSGGSAELA